MAGATSPERLNKRVFISAGEASGDALASELIQRMKLLDLGLEFEGVGGTKMAEQGTRLVANSQGWGAISILESLKVAPRVMAGYRQAKGALFGGIPGLFIAIDFGFVNVRLINFAKAYGWKTLYFMPPGSWRRPPAQPDPRRTIKVPRYVKAADEIVTPFSWSADWLTGMGAPVHWFGHPLKEIIGASANTGARSTAGLVAFLPGSRHHEIKINLPIFSQLAQQQDQSVLIVAPNLSLPHIEAQWRKSLPDSSRHRVVQRPVIDVLPTARAAVVCSGTAALEASLCACPHLVMYKFPPVAVWEAKLLGFKKPEFIGLGNIILNRAAIPEFIQDEATVENLSAALQPLVEDGGERTQQMQAFSEINAAIGGNLAISQTAELALWLQERS